MFFFSLVIIFMLTPLKAEAQANPYKIRIEGNVDLGFEFRRDADAEYGDRPLGYDRAFTRTDRPYFDMQTAGRRAEFRAYAYPVQPLEIYAKVFFDNDLFLGEAHAKLRATRENGDHERGIESFFFFREGRLSVGDPLLSIANDDGRAGNATDNNHSGVATNWWLGRGTLTFPKGKWSGELNFQEFPNERGSFISSATPTTITISQTAEANEAIAAKIRHDYKFSDDLNIAHELLWAHKTFGFTEPLSAFSGTPARRPYNDIFGVDMQVSYKTTNFAIQYHPASSASDISYRTPNNDALAVDLRNLTIIDKPKTGRVGLNATYVYFGRNYRDFMGRQPEFQGYGFDIQNGFQNTVGDNVGKDLSTELYWDVPKYRVNLTYRHQDKWGMNLYPSLILTRKNELDMNMRLIKNFDFRALYTRQLYGLEQVVRDFDASTFLQFANKHSDNLYFSLKMSRIRGSLKVDYRHLRERTVNFHVSGIEASYKLTDRMNILGRTAKIWIERPDQNWVITDKPRDIGQRSDGNRIRTLVVDPFFKRMSSFFQLTYKPTDNSQFFLEYGQGFHTDNDLSLDGDLLAATRRTDPRVFTKLEIWF